MDAEDETDDAKATDDAPSEDAGDERNCHARYSTDCRSG